ncbi:MAG: hypothetical protein NZ750_11935 [Anaerolineae bacterium]|nr:hypothetical protein [Anaerolineae bacterium]MDW8173928.1 hypothetical protein [Anaerolineae bacterium]
MPIILFDLHNTLADPTLVRAAYRRGLGQVMAARYGGSAQAWAEASRAIVADWDSYAADLDLSGDEGYADYQELMLRTTRALFRLLGQPYPAASELVTLTRELPALAVQHGGQDTLYADSAPTLRALHQGGWRLGTASNAAANQVCVTLEQGGVLSLFDPALLMGSDTLERWEKDTVFWERAWQRSGTPNQGWVVESEARYVDWAADAGWRAVQIVRKPRALAQRAVHIVHSLPELLTLLA